MIGLVYADYTDPELNDEFHSLACATFKSLSTRFKGSVDAVTDPDVSEEALARLMVTSDFLFYWGHAEASELVGSVHTERFELHRLGCEAQPKMLYIDGCGIGGTVNDVDFPNGLVIGPTIPVSYGTSVRMGCSLVLELLGKRRNFRDAFELAKSYKGGDAPYSLVGRGRAKKVSVSDHARLGVVCGFFNLLIAWDNYAGIRD